MDSFIFSLAFERSFCVKTTESLGALGQAGPASLRVVRCRCGIVLPSILGEHVSIIDSPQENLIPWNMPKSWSTVGK